MLIFPTYQTMLAKAAATSSGGGSSIVDTDLYVHYDFSDTNCWNRQSGTNTNDYTIHNLANDYNDALIRGKTGTSGAWQNDSSSPVIDFVSSDGGGCLEFDTSNNDADDDDCVLMIPGSFSVTWSDTHWTSNITTVAATDSNNLFNGIGTGAFTVEMWVKVYLNDSGSIYGIGEAVAMQGTTTGGSNFTTKVTAYEANYTVSGRQKKFDLFGTYAEGYVPIAGAPSSGSGWSDWNHLVWSRNSTSTDDSKVYLNNSLQHTVTSGLDMDYMRYVYFSYIATNTRMPIRYGAFRFYRGKALTSSEITTNWNAQKSRFGH